ncbi:MAG: decaprenyl-phosphate phosphoribosyltransferase [Dehalococcoidia bacterium]|nr:MAG: decaprenyl-phosphate phosphoribosyltransferase [Dehalococcoidia bacterium]
MNAAPQTFETAPDLLVRSRPPLALSMVRALRPKQWTKNGAVFMAAVFTINLYWRPGDPVSLLTVFGKSVIAFVIFCALASATYLINDVADIERDRQHPEKRSRPIAAGLVSPRLAIVVAALLAGSAIPAAFLLGRDFGIVSAVYFASQFLYSYVLKHQVILDVFTIAAGFALRVVGGAFAIDVPVSPWLYVCTILGALFLGLCKRRHELLLLEDGATNHRKTLEAYTPQLLDQMIAVVTASTVIAYSLYSFSAENLPKNHAMMLTIPFVLYGLFRYLYLVYQRGLGGSPDELLLRDKPLLIDVALWIGVSLLVLYFAR